MSTIHERQSTEDFMLFLSSGGVLLYHMIKGGEHWLATVYRNSLNQAPFRVDTQVNVIIWLLKVLSVTPVIVVNQVSVFLYLKENLVLVDVFGLLAGVLLGCCFVLGLFLGICSFTLCAVPQSCTGSLLISHVFYLLDLWKPYEHRLSSVLFFSNGQSNAKWRIIVLHSKTA